MTTKIKAYFFIFTLIFLTSCSFKDFSNSVKDIFGKDKKVKISVENAAIKKIKKQVKQIPFIKSADFLESSNQSSIPEFAPKKKAPFDAGELIPFPINYTPFMIVVTNPENAILYDKKIEYSLETTGGNFKTINNFSARWGIGTISSFYFHPNDSLWKNKIPKRFRVSINVVGSDSKSWTFHTLKQKRDVYFIILGKTVGETGFASIGLSDGKCQYQKDRQKESTADYKQKAINDLNNSQAYIPQSEYANTLSQINEGFSDYKTPSSGDEDEYINNKWNTEKIIEKLIETRSTESNERAERRQAELGTLEERDKNEQQSLFDLEDEKIAQQQENNDKAIENLKSLYNEIKSSGQKDWLAWEQCEKIEHGLLVYDDANNSLNEPGNSQNPKKDLLRLNENYEPEKGKPDFHFNELKY